MSAAPTVSNHSSARLLARNTIWNVLGQLLPMAVAVAAIPPVIRGLGIPRFGILSVVWVLIGYFSLFDLGMGRALTKLVAEEMGTDEERRVVPLVWTALLLMLLLGIVGGAILAGISPWLVHRILKIPAGLQSETLLACYLIALCIPFVTFTSGLRGVLEGLQRFRAVNLIRIPMSVFSFAGPLVVLPFSRSLVWVIATLVFGRLIACLVHLFVCFATLPTLRANIVFDRSLIRPLVVFGGWMTVSNVISPILVYVDRFVLGALISTSAIAYYTAPFDVITRLTVVPSAVAGVLFPAFAANIARNPNEAKRLLNRSLTYIFAAVFPAALLVVTLAPQGLQLWLGAHFAENSSTVLRWLTAGVLANSLAHIPFALVQSAGRPDITAKLHVFELPLYMVSVWLLTKGMGIQGTAIAWTARLILDLLLIAYVLQRVIWPRSNYLLKLGTVTVAGLGLLLMGALVGSVYAKLAFVSVSLLVFASLIKFLTVNDGKLTPLTKQKLRRVWLK